MASRVTNQGRFDLYFPGSGLGLMLLDAPAREGRQRGVQGASGPSEFGADLVRLRDIPVIFLNRGRGMGVSQFDANVENDGDYGHGLNIWSRTPGSWMPAGLATEVVISGAGAIGACTSSAVYNNSDLMFGFGGKVIKITAGTDAGPISSAERDLGVGFLAKRMQMYEGILYVGGSGGFMWRFNGSWTQSADVTALDLASVYWVTSEGIGSQRLIVQDTATSFIHIAEGSAPLVRANYSPNPTSYTIAGGTHTINSLVAANQVVWFATTGGLASVDGRGYSPILNPYLAQQFSTLNGECSLYFDGYVFMSHLQGLDRIDVSSLQRQDTPAFCQPGAGSSNETPIYGRVSAMCAEGGYVLASIYNGTDSFLMAGKPDPNAPSGMRWHGAEYHLAGERITHLRVHSTSPAANPCIWICSMAGATPKLRYLSIPKTATPQQELLNNLSAGGAYTGSHRWSTTASLFFGAVDLADQNALKLALRYDLATRRLAPGIAELRVLANAEGGSYTQQGTGADPKVATSPRGRLIPQAPLTEAFNLGVQVRFTGATTAPPILNQLKARLEMIQELRTSKIYRVILGPSVHGRMGAFGDEDAFANLNALLALQSQGPVPMDDEIGNVLPAVKIEPGITWEEVAIKREGGSTETVVWVATATISLIPTTELQLSNGSSAPPVAVLPTLIWGQGRWGQAAWG